MNSVATIETERTGMGKSQPVAVGNQTGSIGAFIRGAWSIALYTYREGMRKKTLIGFLILSMLVIFGSFFLTAFLQNISSGGSETDVGVKLVKDICVTAVSIFGVLITIFISASVVPSEVENRVIYTILSKPIRRFQYLMGKFIGVQMIVILNLVLMGGLFGVALYFREQTVPTLLFWNILLTYFMFLIISAFTFAISCASSSSVLPTLAGLFIYITGNLTQYLKDVIERASEQGSEWLGYIADALYRILPNLQSFSLKEQILYFEINDPPRDIQMGMLVVYAVLYALAGFILAYWVFRRREL